VVFLERANENSLLLIDEFGSGSDPDLGSSLAAVYLQEVHDSECFAIVTTHFNNIKALASNMDAAVNAAMAFHRSTFRPLYQLRIGNPGSSYTFEVAENVGLPAMLIDRARQGVNDMVNSINSLLVELQDEKQSLESTAEDLAEKVEQMKANQQKQNRVIADLEEKMDKQRKMNEDQSEILIWGKRFKQLNDSWIKNPSKENKRNVGGRFWKMMKESSAKSESLEEAKRQKEQTETSKRMKRLLNVPIAVGDKVKIIDTNLSGVVEAIKNDKYIVKMGLMSTSVQRNKIIPVGKKKPSKRAEK
jgi:DNA mismatch repair protein MutS2